MSHTSPRPSSSATPPPPHSPSWSSSSGGAGPQVWVRTQLPRIITTLAATLALNSEDWKARLHALQDIEKLVFDCKEYERANAGTAAGAAFPAALAAHLFTLAPALIVQITDLRSEIVRQASHTLSCLATNMPDTITPAGDAATPGAFHKCAVKVLPAVLTQAASSNSVIRSYAVGAAQDIVANVCSAGVAAPGGGILGHLLNELKNTKNKNVKSASMELLVESVMKRWPKRIWCGGAASSPVGISSLVLEEHLLLALASADTATRAAAFRSVWSYAKFGNPSRASALFKGLEPRTKKGVMESRRAEDEGVILDFEQQAASGSMDDSALPRPKRVPTPQSSARGAGSGGFSAGDRSLSNGHEERSAIQNINLSATSISDGILTKALAEARKKNAAAGAAPPTGAKRVSGLAAPTPVPAGVKKLSALGLPSRVPTKKPAVPTAAAAAPGKMAGGAIRPSSAFPASAPTSPPHVDTARSSLTNSTESASVSPTRPQHSRTISSVQLDGMDGLLNDMELGVDAEEDANHKSVNGANVAASAAHSVNPSADFESFSPQHLKNLSISSTMSEFIVATPVTPSRASSAGLGSRTPRGTSSTSGLATKRSTASAAVAAQALLSRTSAGIKLPTSRATSSSDALASAAKKRQSLPVPPAASATKPAVSVVRRSLGTTASASALKSPSPAVDDSLTTPRKRPVGAPLSAGATVRRPLSAASTSATRSKLLSGTSTPSGIPRPGISTRTPRGKSPAARADTADAVEPSHPPVVKQLALQFGAMPSSNPPSNPSSNPLSAFQSPAGSSLHSPAGVGGEYSSTLLIPSNLPSPASSNGSVSATPAANIPPELALLLRDHRVHLADSAQHLQQLNTQLAIGNSSAAAAANTPPYVDSMIKLLSENLARTTRLLESFMKSKRREINAAQAAQQQQQQATAAAQQQAAALAATPASSPVAAAPAAVAAAPIVVTVVAPVAAPVVVEPTVTVEPAASLPITTTASAPTPIEVATALAPAEPVVPAAVTPEPTPVEVEVPVVAATSVEEVVVPADEVVAAVPVPEVVEPAPIAEAVVPEPEVVSSSSVGDAVSDAPAENEVVLPEVTTTAEPTVTVIEPVAEPVAAVSEPVAQVPVPEAEPEPLTLAPTSTAEVEPSITSSEEPVVASLPAEIAIVAAAE